MKRTIIKEYIKTTMIVTRLNDRQQIPQRQRKKFLL